MLRSRLFALALVVFPAALPGHTDINETIKALTLKIEKEPTAELFYQRATEYRALREKAHTLEDLRSALQLVPEHRPSRIALIGELGKSNEALELAKQLAADSDKPAQKVESAYLLANVYHIRGNQVEALKICEDLQKLPGKRSSEIDLLHTDILLNLKRPADATAVLKKAWNRTNSIVLRNNWIDISLTTGQTEEVLPIIEKELSSSRFRSSWLIRRARARLIENQHKFARADLRAALEEITPRINPERPDLTLIADRGLIHALLGNTDLARSDLATLRQSLLPMSSYRLLTEALDGK